MFYRPNKQTNQADILMMLDLQLSKTQIFKMFCFRRQRNLQMFTFDEQEPDHFWDFAFKNDLKL